MTLIFEKSLCGLTAVEIPNYKSNKVIEVLTPSSGDLSLPELSQVELVRHYTALNKMTYGVDDGFYPLGSCTMKYNPKINEVVASLSRFRDVHPMQDLDSVSGCLKVLTELKQQLSSITGMADFSLAPAAGAHGELTGLLLVKAYFKEVGEKQRKIVLIPDSAHGTNPASANMAGYQVVSIPSKSGLIDIEALKSLVNEQVACLMLTNPNTLGLFEKDIQLISEIIHGVGGLLYYDGANMNAIMGITNPGVMGFDIVHLNLHKTFSTPHGGGGPGSGPVGCVKKLVKYLPNTGNPSSIGRVKTFNGNFLVLLKAYTYIQVLGADGLLATSQNAVLNANYLMSKLRSVLDIPYYSQGCMHEFVMSCEKLKDSKGISALDIAKALIDFGIHPPTIYFPLIVKEALMVEPTETECKERMDEFIGAIESILADEFIHEHPNTTPVNRIDEVRAARNPVLIYTE